MSSWFSFFTGRKKEKQSEVALEQAHQRLDCFMSVLYIFPAVIEPWDLDMLAQRDRELTKIYQYSGWSFAGMYLAAALGTVAMRGRLPFFRKFVTHTCLAGAGTYISAHIGEKIAAELWYN